MRHPIKKIANNIQTLVILVCGVQIFVFNSVLGKKLLRKEPSRNAAEEIVLLPDLLKELEARRVNKRQIRADSKSDRNKNSSLTMIRQSFRNNFLSNETDKGDLNGPSLNSSTSNYMTNMALDVQPIIVPRRGDKRKVSRKVKNLTRHRRKRKTFLKIKSTNNVRGGRSYMKRNRHSWKLRRMDGRRKNRSNKKIAKTEKGISSHIESEDKHEELNSLEDDIMPPIKYPVRGYHLVPYAQIYPLYRPGFATYPRNQGYYQDPYDDQYYVDYEDTQRKDVIPKPQVAPLVVRGSKKDALYQQQSEKRMAYSPIVSAVRNLDRSEANLFDSLFSTNHESDRITGDIGSELSSFVGSPDELEVYTPTDTPGEVYFEKDQKSDHSTHATTNKPTESGVDPADIVDNEEKLLAIVEKVIKKQRKKENADAKLSKSASTSKQLKGNGYFDIGDTSKVFNTDSGDKLFNMESGEKIPNTESGDRRLDVDGKLQDFLSKQPKYVKKRKGSQSPRAKPKGVSRYGGERVKAKAMNRMVTPGFVLSKTGQHVIVENVNPEKHLSKSLNRLGDKKKQWGKSLYGKPKEQQQQLISEQASAKSLNPRVRENQRAHHEIKEMIDEDRKGGLPEGRSSEAHEKHNGFEAFPLSIHESHSSRYSINGRDIPVLSEINPGELPIDKMKSQREAAGAKKDENKPEKEADSEQEKPPNEKEDGNEPEASKDKPQSDQKTQPNEKEGAKEPGTSEKSSSSEGEAQGGEEEVAKQTNGTASSDTGTEKEKAKEPQKVSESSEKADESKNAVQDSKESKDFLDDLFVPDEREADTQQSASPSPHVDTGATTQLNGKPTGWRIRDYYLDNNNGSNWDQIRTAWMGKNGSQFEFNNRINVNPHGTVDTPVTMPPIRFVNGITMPILPTISAPTDMLPPGFPMENDDEEETEQPGQPQQPMQYQGENSKPMQYQGENSKPMQYQGENSKPMQYQGENSKPMQYQGENSKPTPSFGLQYPWQWHNRKPQGGRYYDPQLHFHGRVTQPTLRPLAVTTKGPTTDGVTGAVTKPAVTMTSPGQNKITGNGLGGSNGSSVAVGERPSSQEGIVAEETSQNETTKEEGRENKVGQSVGKHDAKSQDAKEAEKEDEREEKVFHQGVGHNETHKGQEDENKSENDDKNDDREREHLDGSTKAGHQGANGSGSKVISVGRWTEGRKYEGVVKESATFENTTVRTLNQTTESGGASKNRAPQGIIGPYTKAPVDLPILSQPTTKSVQNFLPGVKSPLSASTKLQSGGIDSYPKWSGAYVEHLRKAGRTGSQSAPDANAGTRSEGTGKGGNVESESYQILTEESTRRVPDDGQIVGSRREKTESPDATSRKSFAYKSNLLQREESENVASRARVTDSPINRQAESINEIRQKATAAQKAAQRQIVLKNITTMFEQHNQEGGASQKNYTAKAPGAEGSGEIQPVYVQHTHAAAIPRTTATTPMTEEFHHPTPKPLFPLMFSSKFPTRSKSGFRVEKKETEGFQGNLPSGQESNTSSDQRNIYLPMVIEPVQTTTESTTPSTFGYKTTDWVTALTTTDHPQSLTSEEKPRAPDTGEGLSKPSREAGKHETGTSQNYGNEQPLKTVQAPIVENQTVAEGRYHTDEARVRTAEKVTIQVPEKALENGPTASVSTPQLSNSNVLTTSGYQYQTTYPSIGNTAAAFGPQTKFYNGYQGWAATPNPAAPGSTMQSTGAMMDSYLTKFGDQLNMEDLYWTDSTEEKEQICKKEKGTNEVVHILCFGDSLTRGYYNKGKSHHPYTNKLQFLLNKLDTKKCYILENEGKDGELAYEEMPKRLESVLNDGETRYDWIVILGGTNDIYNKKKSRSVSEEVITQNIISMHEIARKHHSKSVAVTIPEVYCETQDTCQDAKQLRERVNNNIRNYALRNIDRIVLVDLADMLQRANVGRDMAAQFFEGGLHLKPRGYERMAIIIYEGLKRALS